MEAAARHVTAACAGSHRTNGSHLHGVDRRRPSAGRRVSDRCNYGKAGVCWTGTHSAATLGSEMTTANSATTTNSVAAVGSSVPLVEVQDLRKNYQLGETEVHALRGVSVRINPGDFVAIMGASGSGKSTFMNILGCLDKPTSGRYLLEGINVAALTKKELARIRNQKIGFVFQGFNLLGRTTALENTELPMLYSKTKKNDRERRAREALAQVGLAERADHFPSQLSGGQQQRVAIARALVNQPRILLADEPTGNLDSRTSVEVMEIFQKLNRDGLTIVLVTHEPDIANFTQRQIVFRDGHIKRDEVVARPLVASEVLKTMPTIED